MRLRRADNWQPADDLPDIWLDATQTGTGSIQDTTGTSISDGETVGKWISQGGSAFNFVQRGAIARPVFKSAGINGNSSILFNSQFLWVSAPAPGFTAMTAMSGLMVIQRVALVAAGGDIFYGMTCSHDTGNADVCIQQFSWSNSKWNVAGFGRRQADSYTEVLGTTITDGVPQVIGGVWNWNAATLTLYQNGRLTTGPSSYPSSGNTSANVPFALGIGGYAGESVPGTIGFPCNAYIGELLIWKNRALSADELAVRAGYLGVKWGCG